MEQKIETVHTVTGYWDGPRSGIANYEEVPHAYEVLFEEVTDEWSDIYWLMPIDNETFLLALEDWMIWKRWEHSYYSGETSLETHPALPEDKERHMQLQLVLKERLLIKPEKSFKAKGRFLRHDSTKELDELLGVTWGQM